MPTTDAEDAPRATPTAADLRTTPVPRAWAEIAGDFVFERDISVEIDPALFHWHTYRRLVDTNNGDSDAKRSDDEHGGGGDGVDDRLETKSERFSTLGTRPTRALDGWHPESSVVARSRPAASTPSSLSLTTLPSPSASSFAVNGRECDVCFSGFANLIATPCGHTYCEHCIVGWQRDLSSELSSAIESVTSARSEAPLDCYECSICYSTFANPVTTECGHTYCELCLAKWIDAGYQLDGFAVSCPICKEPVYKLPAVNISLRTGIETRRPEVRRAREEMQQDEAAQHTIALWRYVEAPARDVAGRALPPPAAAAAAVAVAPLAADNGNAERQALRALYTARRRSLRAHAEIVARDYRRPASLGTLLVALLVCIAFATLDASVPYSRREVVAFLERDRIEWLRDCANATMRQVPSPLIVFDDTMSGVCDASPGGGMRVASRRITATMYRGIATRYRPFEYRPSLMDNGSVVHPNESRECVSWQPWRVWTLAQAFEHQGDAYWHDVLHELWCPTVSHLLVVARALWFGTVRIADGGVAALEWHLWTALAVAILPRSVWWYLSAAPYARTDPWLALLLLERALAGDMTVIAAGIRNSAPLPTWLAVCVIESALIVPLWVFSELAASVVEYLGAWTLVACLVWRSTALSPLVARVREVLWVEAAILTTGLP